MERNDYTPSMQQQTEVIQIDTNVYKKIITQSQLAVSVEKIEFLMRFVPHLRDDDIVGLEKLKELEVHFVKEEYTKGYHVQRQGSKDEHLYFIFHGKCRLLLSTRVPPMATVFPVSIQERNEWLILDTLHKG